MFFGGITDFDMCEHDVLDYEFDVEEMFQYHRTRSPSQLLSKMPHIPPAPAWSRRPTHGMEADDSPRHEGQNGHSHRSRRTESLKMTFHAVDPFDRENGGPVAYRILQSGMSGALGRVSRRRRPSASPTVSSTTSSVDIAEVIDPDNSEQVDNNDAVVNNGIDLNEEGGVAPRSPNAEMKPGIKVSMRDGELRVNGILAEMISNEDQVAPPASPQNSSDDDEAEQDVDDNERGVNDNERGVNDNERGVNEPERDVNDNVIQILEDRPQPPIKLKIMRKREGTDLWRVAPSLGADVHNERKKRKRARRAQAVIEKEEEQDGGRNGRDESEKYEGMPELGMVPPNSPSYDSDRSGSEMPQLDYYGEETD